MAAPGATPTHEGNMIGLATTDRAASIRHRKLQPRQEHQGRAAKTGAVCMLLQSLTMRTQRAPPATSLGLESRSRAFKGITSSNTFSVVRWRPGKQMDTLGIEPRASPMLSGCDTTTPCAHCFDPNLKSSLWLLRRRGGAQNDTYRMAITSMKCLHAPPLHNAPYL